jgi:hypothetical protein
MRGTRFGSSRAWRAALVLVPFVAATNAPGSQAQALQYALESAAGLRLHNVQAEPATLAGKKGIRVTISPEGLRQFDRPLAPGQPSVEELAVIEGTDFQSGVIEAEIAGAPAPGAGEGARGFVGIAFRVQPDLRTYDAFYLRPTNGRADDQLRRNHSAQYISHPAWPWMRLRGETPGQYESYVDLEPGVWTKVRIEVRGVRARLFVNGQPQPTLVISDVKSGAAARGAIALWIDVGTVAYFRSLRVEPLASTP